MRVLRSSQNGSPALPFCHTGKWLGSRWRSAISKPVFDWNVAAIAVSLWAHHQDRFSTPNSQVCWLLLSEPGSERKVLTKETWFSLLREWKSLKLQWEQFLLQPVRISSWDLVADRKSLVRNSGVGGGGHNLILTSNDSSAERRWFGKGVVFKIKGN